MISSAAVSQRNNTVGLLKILPFGYEYSDWPIELHLYVRPLTLNDFERNDHVRVTLRPFDAFDNS